MYGLYPQHHLFSQVFDWSEFDVFELDEASQGRPLYALAMAIFTEEGLLVRDADMQLPTPLHTHTPQDGWKLDRTTFDLYMRAVQQGYRRDNPYHNSIHAADVTQAVAVMLRAAQRQGWRFSMLEKFSLLLAAVVHDLAHPGLWLRGLLHHWCVDWFTHGIGPPGLTNEFLANTNHRTALLYNDRSINENYHVSCAFRLAHQEPFNIFQHLSKEEYKEVCAVEK